jgi:hypothetical protein
VTAVQLHGMVAAFDEVIDEGIKRSCTRFDVLGRLLAAEDAERHALVGGPGTGKSQVSIAPRG